MLIEASIEWKDSKEIQDVFFYVGSREAARKEGIDDDDIFYYLESEQELYLGFGDFEVISIDE